MANPATLGKKVSSIIGAHPGDFIPCRYTALTSGVAGTFSELGTCSAAEIPLTGTPTPDGLFNYIMSDKGLWIADRVIQTSISWDVLNAAKLIEGVTQDVNIIRSLSGGNSYSDACGNSNIYPTSTVDASLLHFDGNLTDVTGKIWTQSGGAVTSATQSKFGGSSLALTGASQYLTTPSSPDFDLMNEDFTIDWWEYRTASTLSSAVFCRNNLAYTPILCAYCYSGILSFYASSNGASWDIASAMSMGAVILNSWTHYAVVRKGSTFYTFQNGILISSWTSTLSILPGSTPPYIGAYTASNFFQGYIDELRITKGLARWISAFTPPTTPYSQLVTPSTCGVWPHINEWDTYIANSTLNGNISAGDNNLWHWNDGPGSWCRDTPLNGVVAVNGTVTTSNTWRTLRSKLPGYGTSVINLSSGISSTASNLVGLRPVLTNKG
jgi:hypothetical protein